MKLTELTGGEFVINGITLQSPNNKIEGSASSALVNLSDIRTGRSTFSGVNFSFDGISGTAGLVKVNNLNISDTDKQIKIEFSDVSLQGKHEIIQGANITVDINQSINAISFSLNGTSLSGDDLRVVYNGLIDKKAKNRNFKETLLNSEVKDINVQLRNVSLFSNATKEVDWLKPSANEFGLKFFKHHYPKSKRTGKKVLEFLQKLDKISVSMKSEDDIVLKLKDLDKLKHVDNMNIFSKLNLEIE